MTAKLIQTGLLAALLAPVLVAQQGEPSKITPKNPLITLHIDGPAALRARFLPTNLGKMFAGPEFKDMAAPVMQMMEGLKKQAGDEAPFDIEAFEKAVLAYGGRISASFHLLDETIDFSAMEPPAFSVTIVMTPDGKTDLPGFCKKVSEVAKEEMGEALRDLEIGGKTLSYFNDEDSDEPGVVLPFMHKDHAVFLITKDFKRAATAVVAEDAAYHTRDKAFGSASIGASLNVKRIVKLLTEAAKNQMGPQWDDMGVHILKGIGIQSLDSVDITYGTRGPAVLSRMVFNFNQNDRGMMGSIMQAQAARSALIDLLPRNAMAASAAPFDLKKVYQGVKGIFAAMGDAAPESFEEVEEGFKEHFGIRLYEDLIGLFEKDVMYVQAEPEEIDSASPMGPLEGACLGFGVRDGAKLAKSIDTMLRKEGLHAGRKKSEYKGFTVYSMNIAMAVEVSYAVSDRLFLMALGSGGGDSIRAALDEAKNRAEGNEPAAFPAEIANRMKMAKGGFAGMGWSDLELQIDSIAAQLDAVAGNLPPEMDMFVEMLDKMPKLVKTYEAKYQVAVTRSEGNRWIYENIW